MARIRSGQPSDDEIKARDERLTAAEKLAKEREERLQQLDYERSDTYRDTHIKPLQKAFNEAYQATKSLKIMSPEGEEVQMTESHFNALIRMSDDQAEEAAANWFGDNAKGVLRANRILDMRRNILAREEARKEALENHMSTREQRERETREASEREMGKRREMFHASVKEGMERHPEFFKPADDDPKGKELFTKGMSIADMAFTADAPVAPEKVPKLHAAIRNKAGAFDYVAYRLRVANREIAKLQERLDAYQKSDPADPMGNRGGTGREGEQSPEQEIRALATD